MKPLSGHQLSIVVEVPAYPITNPPVGSTIATPSGTATVTRTEPAGNDQIIFADYGSGIEQPHIHESLINPQNSTINRRHSAKGKATGWIEERQGNLKRTRPSISYYYCWQDGDRRGKTYVPVRQMSQVRTMVNDRCSVDEILQTISKRPTHHQTETPKI
jgi:hypothetical protein